MESVLRFLLIFFLISFVSQPVFAQVKKTGFSSTLVEGWENTKSGKNMVARYKLKSNKRVQVDVRSAPVPKKSSERFFSTFHGSLIKAGMKKLKSEKASLFGGVQKTEYEMKRKGVLFKVAVFQLYSGKKAWLVISSVPKEKYKENQKKITELLKSFSFK